MSEKTRIILTDFSGVYRQEKFWREREVTWVDFSELPGTNCYCDGDAGSEIQRKIAPLPCAGLHFLDSGNYHYMSRFWIGKIQEPFRLLVFDNHTDMQLPAFPGLLSCGGWIAAAMDEVKLLRETVLVGPDEEAFAQTEERYRIRTRFLSRERLASLRESGDIWETAFFRDFPTDLPLYLSVDKDVLGKRWANTAWSQGDMSLDELTGCLGAVLSRLWEKNCRILGVDVCGEWDGGDSSKNRENDDANARLLSQLCGMGEGSGYQKACLLP